MQRITRTTKTEANHKDTGENIMEENDVAFDSMLTDTVHKTNTRKRKIPDSKIMAETQYHDLASSSSPSTSNGENKRESLHRVGVKRHSMLQSYGNNLTTHPPIITFFDPCQLGMDCNTTDEREGSTAMMRRDSSLVQLAMIPQVPSMTDLGENLTVEDDNDDDDALEGINFMDFFNKNI